MAAPALPEMACRCGLTAAIGARPQRIAVFGATRGIGRHVVERALAAGHDVSALVRGDASRLGIDHPRLAHARLRAEQHHLTLALRRLSPASDQQCELRVTT